MDSLGIDNNTREIVWKITPQSKKTKTQQNKTKAKTKTTVPKTVAAASQNPDVKELVEAQIKNLSGILFEKIQRLEQDVKKLRLKNKVLENKVASRHDAYVDDAIFQPWYL